MTAYGSLSYQNQFGVPNVKPKKPPTPAAPSTVPAASVPPSGLPLDPTYDAIVGGLQNKRDATLSQLSGQRPRVLADYGYTASGYDSSGAPTGLAFDPNDPFSRAALAKRTFDQSKAGTTTSYAARGQHNSGAYNRAERNVEFGYQQSSDALQKALVSQLVGIASGEANAGTDYSIGAGQAYGDRLVRAQNTPPSPPPAAPAAAKGNPYPPGTNQWAAYAKQHGESWKQVNGKWKKVN